MIHAAIAAIRFSTWPERTISWPASSLMYLHGLDQGQSRFCKTRVELPDRHLRSSSRHLNQPTSFYTVTDVFSVSTGQWWRETMHALCPLWGTHNFPPHHTACKCLQYMHTPHSRIYAMHKWSYSNICRNAHTSFTRRAKFETLPVVM